MTVVETPPIACSLTPGAFKDRLAWVRTLNQGALRRYARRDRVLDLRYAPEAADRVREMIRKEQACCAFLTFDMREGPDEIQLIITAPEELREVANTLFEQFVAGAPSQPHFGAPAAFSEAAHAAETQTGAKAASLTAATLATGAVACGACCVLPFALPAAALASTGSILAWLAGAHAWVTGLAVLAVLGAWAWIVRQTARSRRRPALSTVYVTTAATILTTVAVLWPFIEGHITRALTT